MDTPQVIEAIRLGHRSTLTKALFETALPPIVKYIKERGGKKSDAEDAFQEALIVLVKKVYEGTYDEQYEVKNFLFVLAKNKWINNVKRDNRISSGEIEDMHLTDSDVGIEQKLLDEERQQGIDQLLASAGERCKQLMKLVLFEKKKFKEIAAIMSFSSEEIVKTTNYRCKKKMKQALKEQPALLQLLKP